MCFKSADKCPFEKIQNFILKDILGVHGKSSNLAVKQELGIFPLYMKVFKMMFKYYTRLTKLVSSKNNTANNSLLKNAFIEDCNLTNSGAKSWSRSIQNIQNHFKITDLNISPKLFENQLKAFHTEEINKQIEAIKVNQTGKLSFYSTILKTTNIIQIQNYLTLPISKDLRLHLSRLRISAHQLYIETGRYCKPPIPRENRYCYSCKNLIEDESHFLLICPEYTKFREKYEDVFCTNNICDLLNTTVFSVTKNLCRYIKESFEHRKLMLAHQNIT